MSPLRTQSGFGISIIGSKPVHDGCLWGAVVPVLRRWQLGFLADAGREETYACLWLTD